MDSKGIRPLPEFNPSESASSWEDYKRDFIIHLDALGLDDKPGKRKRVTFAESNLSEIPTCNTMDYQQGDLVWAKVEGHPWWPALVWPGPKGSIFKETKKSKQIHVQFFSEPPTTAWIKEKSVDKFEGKDSPLCQPGKKYHSAKKTFIMALDSAQKALCLTITCEVIREYALVVQIDVYNRTKHKSSFRLKQERLPLIVAQEKVKKGSVKRKKEIGVKGGPVKKQKTNHTSSLVKPSTVPKPKLGPLSFVSRGRLSIKSRYNLNTDRIPQRWRNVCVKLNTKDIPEGLLPHEVVYVNTASSPVAKVSIEMPGDLVEEEDVNDFDSEDEYIDSDNDPVWKPQDKIVDDKGRTSEEDMVADDSDDDPGWVPGKKVGEVTYTKKKKDFTGFKNKVVRAKSKQNITKINSTKEVQNITKINSAKRVQNITKVNSTNVVQDISTADQPNSGDFLIEKEECKDGNIPFLWRFKNDGLIQKYEKKEENGKVFYQNTNNFSDWWSCYANKYEKVSTMVFYKVRSVEKVMLTGSVTSTNRGDTTSVPASDVKQQDQEISSTTPELCPIPGPDKEQFEIGSFVLDKKDCRNVDNFPIWKIESSMLIKKYEACCHQGKLLHKPVKIYRGYMDIEQHYLPLKTKVVTSPGNNDEMVEVSEDTRPKLHVSLSLESLECGNNPLLRHFYVYMQVFLSLALEPGFLDEITKINDETYMEPMNEINKLVKQKLTNIERKVRWTDNLKFALLKCPCLRNVSKPDMTKKCEGLANSEETVSDAVFLFGGDYHPDTLKSTNKQHACQEFRVGKTAMQHIQSYHQLCHFKLNLYEKCKAKIKLIQDSDKETDIEKVMDSCLGNKAWVLQNFEDFTTLVEIR